MQPFKRDAQNSGYNYLPPKNPLELPSEKVWHICRNNDADEKNDGRDVKMPLLITISSAGPSSWEEVTKWRTGRLQHHLPH